MLKKHQLNLNYLYGAHHQLVQVVGILWLVLIQFYISKLNSSPMVSNVIAIHRVKTVAIMIDQLGTTIALHVLMMKHIH